MLELYSHPDKKLYDHLKQVGDKSKNIVINKELDLELFAKKDIADLSYAIGVCHDFAKATSFFQNKLLNNKFSPHSHHGLLSSLFGYITVKEIFENVQMAVISFVIIKKHHGNLESPWEDNTKKLKGDLIKQLSDLRYDNNRLSALKESYEKLLTCYTNFNFDKCFKSLNELVKNNLEALLEDDLEYIAFSFEDDAGGMGIERFLLTNFLYSVLIDTDKKDAANVGDDYFKNTSDKKVSVEKYIDSLKKENVNKIGQDKEINKIRDSFFSKIVNNENIQKDHFLYSLTAPTGIGKTFASYAFAQKLKDEFESGKKIIYCLPYTSIIDQNHSEIEKILSYNIEEYKNSPTKYLLKHHYLTHLNIQKDKELKDENNLNYFDQKLFLESWESANIVTTFVQLFHSIIGNKNSFLKKFHNIVNSIIILDEIQTLPVEYYKVVGKVFEIFAQKFKTYFLFLTATQPKIINKEKLIQLVESEKYFTAEEFDRVTLSVKDLEKTMSIDDFLDFFRDDFATKKSGLIVCNKIKTALKIFNKLKIEYETRGYKIYSLTTNIIPLHRLERIEQIKEEIKNKSDVLVISTQLIEAGVDFSFEKVYRDLAPIDSVVQAAGRCNRENELSPNKGETVLFNLSDNNKEGNSIYDNILIQITKDKLKNETYSSKEFFAISNEYFGDINKERESNWILKAINILNYSESGRQDIYGTPIKEFKLIKEEHYKEDVIVFLNQKECEKIARLDEILTEIKQKGESIFNFDKEAEEIEMIKKELGNYRVSVAHSLLEKRKEFICEVRGIKYVNYKNWGKVYNLETGLIYPDLES